jgi:hypothetical protein
MPICSILAANSFEGDVMPRTITMAVDLPAPPARLYRMYLSPAQHAAFTGAPVKIAARSGAAQIELTHVNVADCDFAGVSEGWSKYYWIPWREYLNHRIRKG